MERGGVEAAGKRSLCSLRSLEKAPSRPPKTLFLSLRTRRSRLSLRRSRERANAFQRGKATGGRRKRGQRPSVSRHGPIDRCNDDGDNNDKVEEEDETFLASSSPQRDPLPARSIMRARALLTFLCRREVLAVRHGEVKEKKEKKKKPTTTTTMGDGSRNRLLFSLSAASFRNSPSLPAAAPPLRASLPEPSLASKKEGEGKPEGEGEEKRRDLRRKESEKKERKVRKGKQHSRFSSPARDGRIRFCFTKPKCEPPSRSRREAPAGSMSRECREVCLLA